ncbi:MAG: serine hydrolase domain-containing protein [Vicinamibacteria bacterium]
MERRFRFAAVAMLSFAVHGATLCGAQTFDRVRDRIHQYVDGERIPSVSIAVVKGEEIVWEEAFGWADVENRVRATPHTAYMLASVSKPITASILMRLHDRGLVHLDRPVNTYLGDAKIRSRLGDVSTVTVREILQHVGGLPNYSETFYADEKDSPPPVELLAQQYGQTMIPQGRFHYSNLGYALLGHVAAQVSGKVFSEVAREELFTPLGMKDSFVPTRSESPAGAAIRYHQGGRLLDYITSVTPAADIRSSAHDLALFAQLHLKAVQGHVLSEAAIDDMQRETVPIPNYTYEYGLGWSVAADRKGRRHVFHGGGSAGCDAHLTLIPEENVAVVILVNETRRWPGTSVTQDLLDITLSSLLSEAAEDVRLNLGEAPASDSRFASELEGSWQGTAATPEREIHAQLTFETTGDVSASLNGQGVTPVNGVWYVDRIFLGKMDGDIGVPAAARRPYDLGWDLTMVDGKLVGVLYAGGRENSRGLSLPFWVELKRRTQ